MTLQVQRVAIDTGIHTAEWLVSTRAGQELLASCYNSDRRPRCMCVPGGVEMYIARRGRTYYLSRMPGTGFLHADICDSVEDAPLFSGATAYAAGAIVERGDGTLRIAADLHRRDRQPEPLTAVSIDGLLDILVEQADINRVAAGAELRTWQSVRDRLLEAAQWLQLEGTPLSDCLFLPERYARENGNALHAACEKFLKHPREHALICAPLREIRQTTYSWQIVLKHLPGLRLWAAKEAAEEFERRWGVSHFASPPEYALCLVAAKLGRREGNYNVTNMACLPTTANYLPCATERDTAVAAKLLQEGVSLLRPLRFDCDPTLPLADFAILASDTPDPVFVLAPSGNDELDAAKRSLAVLMQRNHVRVRVFTE